MTIIRCKKCRIVVLDSNEDGAREVQCMECNRKYAIELQEGEVVKYDLLGFAEDKAPEVKNG